MTYDKVLYNGNIITMDSELSQKTWLAVKDGRIAALGSDPDYPLDAEKLIDLKGMTVLPGLFDAHAHVMPTGFFLNSTDLTGVSSIGEVLDILGKECLGGGDGWVFGGGFMLQNVKEERFPEALRICQGLRRVRSEQRRNHHSRTAGAVRGRGHRCGSGAEKGRRAARQHRGFLSDLGSGKGKSLRFAEDRRLPDPGWRGF